MDDLLQGDEKEVYGDKAYADELAQDISEALDVEWKVQHKAKPGQELTAKQERENRKRSRVRAKGEHAYRIVKNVWGHAKVRYRGLAKNTMHYFTCFGLANLYMARHKIIKLQESYVW